MGKADLQKAANQNTRLYKAVDNARARLHLLKGLEAGLTPHPWKITKGDLRRARMCFMKDLIKVLAIRRGGNGHVTAKSADFATEPDFGAFKKEVLKALGGLRRGRR